MDIPTFAEFLQIAPIATIVMLIAYAGYYLGKKSQEEHVQTLKDWIDDLLKRR